MNDSVKSVVSLVVICLVVTLALSAVNYFTAPVIAENTLRLFRAPLPRLCPAPTDSKNSSPPPTLPRL